MSATEERVIEAAKAWNAARKAEKVAYRAYVEGPRHQYRSQQFKDSMNELTRAHREAEAAHEEAIKRLAEAIEALEEPLVCQ
jgi:hypothetical protein